MQARTECLQNPNREMFIKKQKLRRKPATHPSEETLNFAKGIQHLKTCFGHAYSAESGSVNEESGEPFIPIYNSTFDKSGRLIITADEEGLIKVWSSETGLLLTNLKGHTGGILSNDVSPCNKYFVTSSVDLSARVWDIYSGRCLTAFLSLIHI